MALVDKEVFRALYILTSSFSFRLSLHDMIAVYL